MSLSGLVIKSTDFDSFDVTDVETTMRRQAASVVHIRNQQRSGRKSLTTLAGLASDLDLAKILRFMKRMFSTNGAIKIDTETGGKVIQLQGDVRRDAADFLIRFKVCEKEQVIIHGA